MSAQNFFGDFAERVKRVIAGDDYLDLDKSDKRTTKQRAGEWRQERNRTLNQHRVGQTTPPGTTLDKLYRPVTRYNPNAPSASTVNSSPISSPISPKPTAPTPPKPTGGATTPGMTVKGGLGTALVGAAANYAIPWIVEESTRGARMLLGDKNYNTPVYIKSVNGTNYDIRTSGGMEAYKKAKAQGTGNVKAPPKPTETPLAPPKPTETPSAPTRDTPAPNGGSGSGTRTSPGGNGPINMTAADAARFYQSRGIGGFSSNQLPTTNTNPFSGGTIEAVPFGGQEASVTGNTLGAFTVNGQSYAALDPTGAGAQFNPQAPTIEGGAVRIGQAANPGPKATGKISSSRLSEALNDKAGFQSSMSKYGSSEQDQIRAANMAFLNASDSMTGIQAKDQALGQIYAGGQTYMLNEDGSDFLRNKDGKNIAADKDAKRAYMSGAMNAADYRDTFKGAVMQAVTQTPTDPRQAENPTAQNPVPVSQQPTNTNFGPLIDAEQTGRMLESLKGMKGIGPFVDGPTYGEFLEGRKAR